MTTIARAPASPSFRERLHYNSFSRFILRLILYITVAIGALVFALPFVWMVRTAVMPAWQIYIFPPEWIPAEWHFQNFQIPFRVFPFGTWFLNTVFVSVLATLGTVVSSACAAFSFARLRTPFRDGLFIVLLASMMLPQQVRLVPTYLLFSALGWVNTWLPLIVPMWFAPPFFVFLLRQFFMTIPRELDEAACIDGCSPIGTFTRIHLPLSLPALGVVAIFQFQYMWNDLMTPLVYLRRVHLFTIALGLKLFQGHMTVRMHGLMAASVLSILPLIILFFIFQRQFIQGIVISGVKG